MKSRAHVSMSAWYMAEVACWDGRSCLPTREKRLAILGYPLRSGCSGDSGSGGEDAETAPYVRVLAFDSINVGR